MLYWLIKIGHTSLMHRLRDRSESTLVSKVCTRLAGMLQDTVQQIASKIAALQKGEQIEGLVDRARGY